MRITDLLKQQSISLTAKPRDKREALNEAVRLMAAGGNIKNTGEYRKQVFFREKEGTTGIGEGIAIPHGKSIAVKEAGLAAMVIREGVDFEALDGEPVTLLFLIAAPEGKNQIHLELLSKLSQMLMNEEFTSRLKAAKNPTEFLEIIDKAEERLENKETEDIALKNQNQKGQNQQPIFLLAVTSCPTGIAHTYMAEESLRKAAQKAGVRMKVETRGSGGAKNVITEEEIRSAAGIIVAADAKVPMERFAGKRVLVCKVSDGIHQADRLIKEVEDGELPIYQPEESSLYDRKGNRKVKEEQQGRNEQQNENRVKSYDKGSNQIQKKSTGVGHKIYTWLMNGVSHMLPFVVGGGILIAIAFLIDGFSINLEALSPAERQNFGSITKLAAFFKNVGGAAFQFMLPVLAGYIAMAIGDRPALAPGFVGGVIATTGKSGFLGALAAGFLAGLLIYLLKQCCERLPQVIEKLAPVLIYPVIGILLTGVLMQFTIEPLMGVINLALNQGLDNMSGASRIVTGVILAAMMAIDMGGPFNKAAYVFGTAAIASGNYDLMAAVMIGGMVPPCAIALAALVFRNGFSKEERESAPANFIMGLSFITEGAIPYAAADPFRVIPSCMLGSGLAGALSIAFGCTLMAPHGGIFVFPVVGNAWLYLVALIAGSIVAAFCLGILKKTRKRVMA